ncbi:long-chain-fatty-acid--CoA ligase [Corynebacterium liangguodongii]|uniref:Long-chain fatty acid--CoA ligase n=1 Tax=Corynebacterium liangguodongii TaxID=2079535 RepID=A0A2S0WBY2_9CORY|nr:long-chain-fatty-acid--CoA ligase [Corynebacterium liangguodongii]AWB83275.1 long-chain fatty acid--CoA ligase [Corynebacterium liangguodongii]PWC00635.1 long-chain fatty acid--CoA ligase [Corynebacterium liangguodongii]
MGAREEKAWLDHYAPWTPHEVDLGDDTVVDIYERNLARYADRTATWFFGNTMTYAELDENVVRAAAGLQELGVSQGDRVALIMPNCPQHVIAFVAVMRIGATVVEHNPLYTAAELTPQFQDHGAEVAIVWDKIAPTISQIRKDSPLRTIVSVNMIEAMPLALRLGLKLPVPKIKAMREKLTGPAPATIAWQDLLVPRRFDPPARISQDDTLLILYTSGTTGVPKGAQLTHGNLNAMFKCGVTWVKDLGKEPEKIMTILPMFHIYGLALTTGLALGTGSELILVPAPEPELIAMALKKNPPTFFPGVPTLYERISQKALESGSTYPSIRNSFSGASTLPASTIENWQAITGGRLVEGYGLTETSPILTANPMDGNHRPGYVGVPFPNTDIRIANPDNLDETMPDGEPGELLARGPQVFKGYLNRPEATAEAFHDGWFRTGDMGVMEPDGFVRLVSRVKEMIITGGFNVYPDEVELALREHPDIEDIAVIGRPRSDGSEDVVACVTLRQGAEIDSDSLRDWARERLTPYKVPRTFYHFEELARDLTGKIRRREVSETLEALREKGEETVVGTKSHT